MALISNPLRGIIHCHSKYSYDSIISISSYLRFARDHDLNFVMLTDHDTMQGSLALREAATKYMPTLEVPLAAEYLTEFGDIIVAFLKSEIRARSFDEFVIEARSQEAILIFPHPYVSHSEIERIASECDLIEVFNSRASAQQNAKALELAANMKRRTSAGTDAHLFNGLSRVILEVENRGDLRTSLLCGKMNWVGAITPRWEIATSQVIKACKKRDPSVAWNLFRGGARHIWLRFVR